MHKVFKDEMFRKYHSVVIGDTKELHRVMKSVHGCEKTCDIKNSAAITYTMDHGESVVHLKFIDDKKKTISASDIALITHEVGHVVIGVCDDICEPPISDREELFCYYQQWMVKGILEWLFDKGYKVSHSQREERE